MENKTKRYWKGIEQLTNDSAFVKNAYREFPELLQDEESKGSSRRDFLKMMGFSLAAASLAACEAPVRKAIPYVVKPTDVDPSVPNYYASTYVDGGDYCSLIVKTREGRPIKLAGNPTSSISQGGISAQIEASILSLYDKQRLSSPLLMGNPSTWEEIDGDIIRRLERVSSEVGSITLVSNTLLSPTTQKAINEFLAAHNARHIVYDSQSTSGILQAYERTFGKAMLPTYDFSQADVIVSFSADFLGTWIAPIEFNKQYSKTRKLGKDKKIMSRHYQYEANLSLTGSNADYRIPVKPSQEGLLVAQLYNLLAAKAGRESMNTKVVDGVPHLEQVANDLWASRGKSLVVAGTNDVAVQSVVNAINELLGNFGNTIDIDTPAHYRKGIDADFDTFVSDVEAGRVGGVIFYNCNPVYDHPAGGRLSAALEKVNLRISTSDRLDETAALCDYVTPDHHYLESWNDAEPKAGIFSLAQPTITPLFDTRQAQESFLKWAGNNTDYYTYLQENWRNTLFRVQTRILDFQTFWDRCLFDGVLEFSEAPMPEEGGEEGMAFVADLASLSNTINQNYQPDNPGLELVLYQKVSIGSGRQANNPWLQEMPDPISKACWDNYLTISQAMANELGIRMVESTTQKVNLSVNGQTVAVPVLIQPGQAVGTVGLAVGYGRTLAGKVGNNVGVNAYPFAGKVDGHYVYFNTADIQVTPIGESYEIAQTQTHETYMGRETVIQEATLAAYQENPMAGRFVYELATSEGKAKPEDISLWHGHRYPNHHWGMVIDLNSCTGCGACTIACVAENNVPVVGKKEVLMRREMHWLRIDRYYSSDAPVDDLKGLEKASENPDVTFQPMLCQQCNTAPCETVCPVLATTHSSEGLNQMTYNRCIGTRYCANNCPYKVRRFNWFKYHDNDRFPENLAMNNDLGKMVLNPDVTVRARGVMEKCTFCVQRIQAGKLEARREGRKVRDGEIVTACASACPTDAIIFGDMNDPDSRVSQLLQEEVQGRAYHVLQEIRTLPNISYLTKIRNKENTENEA